ncbi:MAG: hypothetical protein H6Q73_170 [Firmicutes bacterium]|nr:hypothetical protein [Bacillota bacterium]
MITLILPDVPPSLNRWARKHWRSQSEIKKRWEQEVWAAAVNARVKGLNLLKAKVHIVYEFKTNARRDKDNYTPKFIMDGLVKSGVIVDDNDSNIDLSWELAVAGSNATRIMIEAVS